MKNDQERRIKAVKWLQQEVERLNSEAARLEFEASSEGQLQQPLTEERQQEILRQAEETRGKAHSLEARYRAAIVVLWCTNRHVDLPGIDKPSPTILDKFKVDFEVVDTWEEWKDPNIKVEYNNPNDLPHADAVGQGQNIAEFTHCWENARHPGADEVSVQKFWQRFFKPFNCAKGITGSEHFSLLYEGDGRVVPDAFYYRDRGQSKEGRQGRTHAVSVEVKRLASATGKNGVADVISQTVVDCLAGAAEHGPKGETGKAKDIQTAGVTIFGVEVFMFFKLFIPWQLVEHVKLYGHLPAHKMPRYTGRRVPLARLICWPPPANADEPAAGWDTAYDFANNADQTLSLKSWLDTMLHEMQYNPAAKNNSQ